MSEGGRTARSDLWGGAGWMAFGALIVFESWRMERFERMGAVLYTMPGFVPAIIGAVLMLLGLVLALRGWRRQSAPHEADEAPAPLLNRRTLATLVLMLLYAGGLIGRVHFMPATALFVTAFVWLFAPPEAGWRRRAVAALLAGVLTALVVDLVFEDVFLVRLP